MELTIRNGVLVEVATEVDENGNEYTIEEFLDTPIPTEKERITALEEENALLKAQIDAQSAQMDFYEECIVEMAEIVYA